ncbi:MAG: MFS transporter [Candidatus Saccharibacteria bacterium]
MSNVKKLQILSFIGGMTFYTPIFTLFLLQRNVELGFIVAAQTLFTVGMLVSTIPTGILADRWGQKLTIQIGMILDIVSMLFLLALHSPSALLVFFTVRGIGIGFRDGADEALLYESYIEEEGSASGYSRSFGKLLSNDTLGFVVATALAGFAVQVFGSRSYVPLIIATAIATTGSLILASTLRMRRKTTEHHQKERFIAQLKSGATVIKKNRTIVALTVFGLLTLNGEYFLRQTYQPQFTELGVPAIFLGLALSGGKLLNFVAMRNAHRLEKYFTVDKILLWITLSLGLGYVLLSLSHSVWSVIVIFMLIQGLLNSQQPIISDYINQQIVSGQRSTTLSTVSFIQNIGQILARVLLGVSIGVIGLGHTYLAQGLYLILGGVIGVWYIRSCGCVHKITHTEDSIVSQAGAA